MILKVSKMIRVIFLISSNFARTTLGQEYSTDLGNVLPQSKYDTCGFSLPEAQYPFLAAIGYESSKGEIFYGCDGVLINRLYVLTSARCHSKTRQISEVLLGVRTFEKGPNCTTCLQPQRYAIKPEDIIVHERFIEGESIKNGNDIALVRLPYLATTYLVNRAVPVLPICIAFKSDIPLPTKVNTVTAWQRRYVTAGNFTKVSNKTVEVVNDSYCTSIPIYRNIETVRNLCVTGPNGTSYPCQGLSGSPLVVHDDKYVYLKGILSVGARCASKRNIPDIYTNVQNYVNWITDNIKR